MKFSPRGSLVTIRAGFKAKSPTQTTSIDDIAPNGHPSSMAPRGSLQRIKEAILKKSGSLLSRNSAQNSVRNALPPKSESVGAASHNSGFRSFRFGQSVRGGAVGPNPPSTDDVIGK